MNGVQFIGLVLFAAAVVRALLALNGPLSRRAQRRQELEALAGRLRAARASFSSQAQRRALRNPDGTSPRRVSEAEPIHVTFLRSGKVCAWDPRAPSLLEFAEENGIELAHGCRNGNCGACLIITSGQVRYLRDPGTLAAPGTCLACIAVPKTHVVLDA